MNRIHLCWPTSAFTIAFFATCVFSSTSAFQSDSSGNGTNSSCYAEAVYNELMRAINIINSRVVDVEDDYQDLGDPTRTPIPKKLQEDEDYGTSNGIGGGAGGGLEIPPFVPMIFRIVGAALSLNSSGVTENSLGFIPERLSNRLTSVLGNLANSILGPVRTTPRPPPRRRRRTTTTMSPSTSSSTNANNLTIDNSASDISPPKLQEMDSISMKLNETNIVDEVNNSTEKELIASETLTNETTTEVLFKESSLGELPVYAAAYAPNYVPTTSYPVYAGNFLHHLYAAPTTPTTSSTPSTSTADPDPNSYAISLPFDYEIKPPPEPMPIITSTSTLSNNGSTFFPNIATTLAAEYEEYEYEEQTEESAGEAEKSKDKLIIRKKLIVQPTTIRSSGSFRHKEQNEDDDDEYNDNDPNTNRSLSSLGRISRSTTL